VSAYHGEEGIVDVEKRKLNSEYTLEDPTVFPPEFLSWLKRFIEQSGIQLPASAIFGSFTAGISSVRNLAPGIIIPYASEVVPPGALACDGASYSRAEYAKLFDIIGVKYGSVDAVTFNVPDYRDRTLYGIGATLAAVTQNDGRPMGQRGPSHHHGVSLATDAQGGHSHGGGVGAGGGHSHGGSVGGGGGHSHTGGTTQNGGHAHGPGGGNQFAHGQGTTAALGSGGTSRYVVAGFAGTTSVDGDHNHSLNIDGVGDHVHGLSIDGVGDHGHGLTIDAVAAHAHTAAGNTSGGGGADAPAYHGILYVITTG